MTNGLDGCIFNLDSKNGERKDFGNEEHDGFIKLIRSLSVPAAEQQGRFDVWKNSGKT